MTTTRNVWCLAIYSIRESLVKPVLMLGERRMPNTRSAALRWYGHTAEFVPGFNVVWKRESGNPAHWHSRPSTLEAHFTWCFPSEIVDQSLDDTRLTLEHYLNWE